MPSGISVVVPVYNEESSLTELHARLTSVLGALAKPYEIIFVNDGSVDATSAILHTLAASDPHVGGIHFRNQFGKAAALDAGFQAARFDVVVTMDADLQDEPGEIPRMLYALESGLDVVSGWKKNRHDPISKTIPSRLFNFIVRKVSGLDLRDFNCGFKAYRSETLRELHLYGELHRYIPMILHWQGFKVGEVAVTHHPRRFGKSKYGCSRLIKGFFDLLTVLLNTRYRSRPLHLFGSVGVLLGGLGFAVLCYLSWLWFAGVRPIGTRPLFFLGILLVMVGIQLVSTGLLGEMIQRNPQRRQGDYYIRAIESPRIRDGSL